MVNPIKPLVTQETRLHDLQLEREREFINELKPASVESGATLAGFGPGNQQASAGAAAGAFLPISGGIMNGPIGFNPILVEIVSNEVDLSRTVGFFTGRLILNGEGGDTADIIEKFVGGNNDFPGRMISIQGTDTETITFKHKFNGGGGGDIRCPGAVDFILQGENNITLIYDAVNDEWTFMDGGLLGSGSIGNLSDVVITSAAIFNHLEFDGTNWINVVNLTLINNAVGFINWRNAADTENLGFGVSGSDNLSIIDFTTGAPHKFFFGGLSIEDVGFIVGSAVPAASGGFINMANAQTIEWRNNANTLDASLQFSGADQFIFTIGANIEFQIGDLDITVGSAGHVLGIFPTGNGLSGANLGGGTQSWNDLNVDRIILRHNDGILATVASIGVFSTALVLNTPDNNEIFLRVNNVDEYFFDKLGFKIKNLNSIFFLDATNTQDARIEYLDPLFRFVGPDIDFEVTSVTPTFSFFGPNQGATLLAVQQKYFAKNTTPATHEYARMQVIIDDPAAGSEDGSIRWSLTEGGVEDVGYLRLNALFQAVQVFKDLSMGFNDILLVNDMTLDGIIKSRSATEIGIQVGNESLTVGTEGSLIGPYFQATTYPSNAATETDFGNVDGGIGVQHDTDAGGSADARLVFRAAGVWYFLTGFKL